MEHTSIILPSFGRRHGRTLRPQQKALTAGLLPRLLIPLPEGNLELSSIFAYPERPLWFEIGFGAGEHLLEQAKLYPEVNFIGCEPYMNGVASLLAGIEKYALTNIRLFDDDARTLLLKLPDNAVHRLYILFPDPWRKARHHKRRIIAPNSLAIFYAKLAKGAELRIATDHFDYCTWIVEQMIIFGKFHWQAHHHTDWDTPPADWIRTRYQAKAEAQGRPAVFLNYSKQEVYT